MRFPDMVAGMDTTVNAPSDGGEDQQIHQEHAYRGDTVSLPHAVGVEDKTDMVFAGRYSDGAQQIVDTEMTGRSSVDGCFPTIGVVNFRKHHGARSG